MRSILYRVVFACLTLIGGSTLLLAAPFAVAAPPFKVVALSGFGFVKARASCNGTSWSTDQNLSDQPSFDLQATAPCQGTGQISAKGYHRAISQNSPVGAGDTVILLSSTSARAQAYGAVAWGNWKDQGENESYWQVITSGLAPGMFVVLKGHYVITTHNPVSNNGWSTAYAGVGVFDNTGTLVFFYGKGSGDFYACVPSGSSFGIAVSSDAAAQAVSVLPAIAPSTTDASASARVEITDQLTVIPGNMIGGCTTLTFSPIPAPKRPPGIPF